MSPNPPTRASPDKAPLSNVLAVRLDSSIIQVESPVPTSYAAAVAATYPSPAFAKGSVTVNMPQTGPPLVQIDVSVIGTVRVDTHKLALGWIKGGATSMRSANSQAAELVHRKVYSKTVTIWRSGSTNSALANHDDDACSLGTISDSLISHSVVPFMIPISEKCPSSVTTDTYSVDYVVKATLYTGTSTAQKERETSSATSRSTEETRTNSGESSLTTAALHPYASDQTGLIVQSVRSRQVLDVLDGVCVQAESLDSLVTVDVKADKEEVVMVEDWEVAQVKEEGSDLEWRFVEIEVDVNVKADIERVESVEAVWKQSTEFRFTALKEDMEHRKIIRENGRIEQARKLSETATIHIPVTTKTIAMAPITTYIAVGLPQPQQAIHDHHHNHHQLRSSASVSALGNSSDRKKNLRISTASNDIIGLYASARSSPTASPTSSRTAKSKQQHINYGSGIKSAAPPSSPSSPNSGNGAAFRRFSKRKCSLPDLLANYSSSPYPLFHGITGDVEREGNERTLMQEPHGNVVDSYIAADANSNPKSRNQIQKQQHGGFGFKPFSFLKKLAAVTSGTPAAIVPSTANLHHHQGPDSRKGAQFRSVSNAAQSSKGMTANAHANNNFKYIKDATNNTRSIRVKVRVPLDPKDVGSKTMRLPGTRLREVTRTHFVVVRVKYHVKKERVQGPLRHDRYVEVSVPLRLVHLRV